MNIFAKLEFNTAEKERSKVTFLYFDIPQISKLKHDRLISLFHSAETHFSFSSWTWVLSWYITDFFTSALALLILNFFCARIR